MWRNKATEDVVILSDLSFVNTYLQIYSKSQQQSPSQDKLWKFYLGF